MTQNGISTTMNGNCNRLEYTWNICNLLTSPCLSNVDYGVIVLNRPITQNTAFMMNLWNNAKVRVTVDGGTKQWDKYISNLSSELLNELKEPELITGDFDSITEEIMQKYKTKGCKIIHTPDQNATDFTKAIIELNSYCKSKDVQIDEVIVVCQSSGRVDQIMGNINTLFLCKERNLLPTNINLYIMSDDSLSWLLFPGTHEIEIPEHVRRHKKPWCSLIPVGEKCEAVTTSGLKWNLDNASLSFGAIVSSSNTYNGSPIVTITCSHTILWSMKVPCFIGP